MERRVFVLWTDERPLTTNREAALCELRTVCAAGGVRVELVTPGTLDLWTGGLAAAAAGCTPPASGSGSNNNGLPRLHAAYEHLTAVHRADYLRAYLALHWGGGSCDLKRPAPCVLLPTRAAANVQGCNEEDDEEEEEDNLATSLAGTPSPATLPYWAGLFARMDAHPEIEMLSFNDAWCMPPGLSPEISAAVHAHRFEMPSQAAFVCRAGSRLTRDWVANVETQLDKAMPGLQACAELKRDDKNKKKRRTNPRESRDGGDGVTAPSKAGYPLVWHALSKHAVNPAAMLAVLLRPGSVVVADIQRPISLNNYM